MSFSQKPPNYRTPLKSEMGKQQSRLTSPNSISTNISQGDSKQSSMQDDSKLPFLKRSGTYIVESPSTHITNLVDNTNKMNIGSKPMVKPVPKAPTNRTSLTNIPRSSSIPTNTTQSADSSNTDTNTTPNAKQIKPSLSMIKQQKRAEMQKLNSKKSNDNNVEITESNSVPSSNNKSIDFIIKNARRTGQLNLSDYGLNEVPGVIWNINIDRDDIAFDKTKSPVSLDNNDFKWWDQVELNKLILASNKIKQIPRDIQQLTNLTTLDIHDNQVESIDDAIGTLSLLQTLNISHNQLMNLPNGICELKRVANFNASHNKLTQLPKNIGHMDDLEDLNLSNNKLNSIPKSFGWLSKLRKLNLSTNFFVNLIPEVFSSSNLKIIDLSENQIAELPKEINELSNLEQLFVRQNKIKKFPTLKKCCKLKDLDISFNQITEIDEKNFDYITSIVNLNLRDNKVVNLPKTIQVMQNLERLDLSNNDLSGLPFELATIESLKQILLTGNPLRSIRRDIISRGTDAIMKYLRNHLEVPSETSNDKNESEDMLLKSDIIKASKVFDISCRKLTNITPNMISYCKQSTALALNASKNSLSDLPNELEMLNNQLNELNLSFNIFTTLPKSMFGLSNLVSLDLRSNRLTSIPYEISRLTAIRELFIADNKLIEIPAGVYELPILENLFANNNQIKAIDPNKIINMKFLATLNLQNNDIMNVPPELGKAEQIKSLQLEGNPFKIPRTQILAKGTLAIMEYLRGRLTET